MNKMTWPIEEIASIIGRPESELKRAIAESDEPFVFGGDKPIELTASQSKAINEMKIPGVFAVKEKLYHDQTPATAIDWHDEYIRCRKEKALPGCGTSQPKRRSAILDCKEPLTNSCFQQENQNSFFM